ncbi:Squalene-hopene cyclase N-terminal domain-containing protein [Peptoclostridium litorale DSM 5388]|uniref:S-layer domain-containing protein n=1 Tax=Peptoclostridium litorale DSM 5388 TaxID=1121324 RepID=A0A069RGP4_PEPLI|nr:S-layer homology domain-containing protein [Peptoclostridium litorale]KDR96199.1 S-layer domain-containing protein [Peptoclostridium litorale DSM 5388]SIO13437.1 Squalene-hopene cyclase N-terminal domain-containing protein [Peptoclostridium litorale DSM 5388]
MKKIVSFILSGIVIAASMFYTVSSAAEIQAQYYIMNHDKDAWGILSLYASDNDVSEYGFSQSGDSTYSNAMRLMAQKAVGSDVSAIAASIRGAQMENGQFAMYPGSGEKGDLKAHIWSIISLYSAWDNGYDKSAALRWLKTNQNSDGGFAVNKGEKSDLKTTAQAILAFKSLGMESEESVQRALGFLSLGLKSEKDCETLSWALMAKSNLGHKDKGLLDRIRTYRLSDGSFSDGKISGKPDYKATSIALAAVTDYEKEYSVFKKLHNADMFSDVKRSDSHYPAVMEIVNRGIASGYPDYTFRPQNKVTRAEFSKFLIYAMEFEGQISKKTTPFKDVKEHWSSPVVSLAYSKGLVSGIEKDIFAPDQNVTGAQVMTMLVRAKGLEGIAARFSGEKWYDGYVNAAQRRGLLYEGFDPDEYATRAQCAQAISRLH